MNMPKELGGGGMTMLQQTLVSEQLGRVTNALGWCVHTPPAWAPAVVTPEQMTRWIEPAVRGERHECYAITEEGAGSDVDAIASTARRDGDEYVLNGVKMHVTSFNTADYIFFQGKIADGRRTPASTRCSSSITTRRASGSCGCRATPIRTPISTRSWRSRTCASPRRT